MKKLVLISALVFSLAVVGSAQAPAKKEAQATKKEVAAPVAKKEATTAPVAKKAVKKAVKKDAMAPAAAPVKK